VAKQRSGVDISNSEPQGGEHKTKILISVFSNLSRGLSEEKV
jgi:hypothetical protein